jgi:hypothetical protein
MLWLVLVEIFFQKLDLGTHFVHVLSLLFDKVPVLEQKAMRVQSVENRHRVEQFFLGLGLLV